MFPLYEKSVTIAWLNTHKQRVRKDELFMRIQPNLSDRLFIAWKHNLLFCILYTFSSIFEKKRLKKTRKSKKKNNYVFIHRQTGNHIITSEICHCS